MRAVEQLDACASASKAAATEPYPDIISLLTRQIGCREGLISQFEEVICATTWRETLLSAQPAKTFLHYARLLPRTFKHCASASIVCVDP